MSKRLETKAIGQIFGNVGKKLVKRQMVAGTVMRFAGRSFLFILLRQAQDLNNAITVSSNQNI
jgi:hypothetical protein